MGEPPGNIPLAATAVAADDGGAPHGDWMQCPDCGGEFARGTGNCPRDGSRLETASPDPLRGQVFGNTYRIVRRIAVGGMGRVYEAEHARLPQRFAIKVMHDAQAHRPEAVQRFEREALETSRLRSEHVVDVVDLLHTSDRRPCLVAEYLEGETLQARLDRVGRLDADRAVAIAIEICRGLAVAHEHSIVHRDLKPSNIFLVQSGDREVVKLVDFGVAKVEDQRNLTQTGAFVGTPAYMAPEQANSASKLDHRADIYAAGAVLYHSISGEPPYGREDAAATLMKLLKGEPPRVRSVTSAVPPGLEAIIERAMARDAADRYATVEELRAELVQLARLRRAGGREPVSGGSSTSQRTVRWLRPVTLALVCAGAVVSGAWVAALGRATVFSTWELQDLGTVHRTLFALVPSVVAVGVLALGLRQVITSWRSGPRVRRLAAALRWSFLWGFGALAVLDLALGAWQTYALDSALLGHREHAIILGIAGVGAVTAFVLSWLRR